LLHSALELATNQLDERASQTMSDKYFRTSRQLITSAGPGQIVESQMGRVFNERVPEAHGDSTLAGYWYVVWKFRWTIVFAVATLTAIAAVVSFLTPPIYEATARVEIEAETPLLQSQSANDIYQKTDADEIFLQTQIQVIESESLAWQTIERLQLASHLSRAPLGAGTLEDFDKHKVQLIGTFRNRVRVVQVPKTRMLLVTFQDEDPKIAAGVATSLVNGYLEYNFRQKDEAIRRSGWMEQQVQALKTNVEKSQEAVVRYEQQNQIVIAGDKQNVLEQMLSDQSRDLASARSERIQKESLYRQVTNNRELLASLVHDELLDKLEEKSADLKQRYTETVAQYGPNFPNAKRLQLEISANEGQIEREQDRIINRISSDYNAATQREKLAAASVAQQKEEVGKLNQLLVQDNMLRHEFETNEQLYENLLQRLKDATVSAALRSTNIHMVDAALPPDIPVRPRKLLNIVVGMGVGLVVGIIGAFAQEGLDSSVKTVEEAEDLMLTPALAVIPFERSRWFKTRKAPGTNGLALNLTKHPNSALSEGFRALGTAVSVSSMPVKTLLITSTQIGEGKTTTALNLAQALAQRRFRVLLIDCDLRKGGLAKAIGLDNPKGLTEVVSGVQSVSEVLRALEPNLWVLPSGRVLSDPVAVLASQEMATLLKSISSHFDFVIIDSPPVLAVTDAAILAGRVDGVLLVAASGTAPRLGLIRTRRILEASGARILGLAVNKLDVRHPGYCYSYSTTT
jgi:polysaccharide biosynthesis transport protein